MKKRIIVKAVLPLFLLSAMPTFVAGWFLRSTQNGLWFSVGLFPASFLFFGLLWVGFSLLKDAWPSSS